MLMFEAIRTALVIAPHPDDEVLGVGGTMARLAAADASVHVAIVTRAAEPMFGAEVQPMLERESAAAHRCLGVKQTHHCGLPAAQLDQVPHSALNSCLVHLVETLRPDTVFVPFVGDLHLDHHLTFISSLVACRPRTEFAPARILAYETLSETNWSAPGITPAFNPNVFIDVSETLDRKIEAFQHYASQVREFPDERSPEVIRALATLRGATVYKRAAEAFMLIRQTA